MILLIAACIALMILIPIIIVMRFIYKTTFYSSSKKQSNNETQTYNTGNDELNAKLQQYINKLNLRDCEEVYITSYDGLKLFGRYYHAADGAPINICMHGYRGSGIRDFCAYSEIAFKMGHNLLLVDQRAQGNSEGKTMTFGILEKADCLKWIEYCISRFGRDSEIILYGVSMGAATVLMAAAENPPENVKGVIADSPYSSPLDIIEKVCVDKNLNFKAFSPLIKASAFCFGHFRFGKSSPVNDVSNIKIPIMLIHGEADNFVPLSMSERIYKNSPDGTVRYTFPNAPHCLAVITDFDRYNNLVKDFCEKCLKEDIQNDIQ